MKFEHNLFLSAIIISFVTGCSGTQPKLGVHDGKLQMCPSSPNCVSSQAVDEEHAIAPIKFNGNIHDAKDRLINIIGSEKRTKIVADSDDYLLVEYSSAVFRFVDDVEFYFIANEDNTQIEVRSASRVGHSDFGVNRERIERIRELIEQ